MKNNTSDNEHIKHTQVILKKKKDISPFKVSLICIEETLVVLALGVQQADFLL